MRHCGLQLAVLLVSGAIATSAGAGPSQADMDFCNKQAADLSKGSPVQPGAGGNQPVTNAPPGRISPDTAQPGTPVQPGTQGRTPPMTGQNPTGGLTTDSPVGAPGALGKASSAPMPGRNVQGATDGTKPDVPIALPAPGMAEIGKANGAYRQAYLTCLEQRK